MPKPLPADWQLLPDLPAVLEAGQHVSRQVRAQLTNGYGKPFDSRTFNKVLEGETMTVRTVLELAKVLDVSPNDLFMFVQKRLSQVDPATNNNDDEAKK